MLFTTDFLRIVSSKKILNPPFHARSEPLPWGKIKNAKQKNATIKKR
jgi:hypothetical protein